MSLIACGGIHQSHKRFSDDSQGRQKIFMYLAVLLCEKLFMPIREWIGDTRIKSYSWKYATSSDFPASR